MSPCHQIYKEENFIDRVMDITSGKGVDVAYDSVEKDTFEMGPEMLKCYELLAAEAAVAATILTTQH
ncbi:putative 2-haloacrylate reductase [Helianthus annuus]|nr:putative 2-haloacrylate reductase [Helianthus annuus]